MKQPTDKHGRECKPDIFLETYELAQMSSQTSNAEVVDAIFRERDQLKTENAKLWKLGEQYETVLADYRSEVVKLRELLQRTWDVFHNASGKEFDAVKQELRELGIEV